MRYGDIESALVRIFDVKSDIGAFKAKIRRLRSYNCPPVLMEGSGTRAEYSHDNALELAIALSLQSTWINPGRSAKIASGIMSGRYSYCIRHDYASVAVDVNGLRMKLTSLLEARG